MITFAHRYPAFGPGGVPIDRSTMWACLFGSVVGAPFGRHLDAAGASPLASAVDLEREVAARGEQVLERVRIEAETRITITRLTGCERGYVAYELVSGSGRPEVRITACLAFTGVSPGSAAEQHLGHWAAAELHSVGMRLVRDAGRSAVPLASNTD